MSASGAGGGGGRCAGCLKESMRICGSFIIKLYEANSLMKQYGKKGSKEKGISILI